jgi:hypothetical protein
VTYIGQPVLVDGAPTPAPSPAPAQGRDTEAILRELGYPDGEIARLAADRVTTSDEVEENYIALNVHARAEPPS